MAIFDLPSSIFGPDIVLVLGPTRITNTNNNTSHPAYEDAERDASRSQRSKTMPSGSDSENRPT